MHGYLITRGIKHEVDAWITNLQHLVLPKGKDLIQLSVRPLQFWELVFPEEALQHVLTTIKPAREFIEPKDVHLNKYLWAMRKSLGAKPVPTFDEKAPGLPMVAKAPNVHKLMIGIKEDIKKPVMEEVL